MQSPSATAAPFAAAESETYTRVMWRLLPFLFLCYLCAYLDRINVGYAKLQMMQDLGLSDAVYGLGAGIFFVGYLLFEVPSNLILLRVGARRWIARIMVTWGVISAAMMFVKSPTSFYIMRFLLGVAEAGFIPAILLYLTYWFPASRRSKVTALFLTGIPMSGVIGGPLSGWIMSAMHGSHGWAGWQWLFLLEGIPTVLVGVIAYFYLDDKVADAKWLTAQQRAMIETNLAAESRGHALHSVRDGLTNPRILLLSVIYFFFTMGLYGVSFWLPTIVKASGVSDPLDIGLLSAIPYAAATVSMILVGQRSDARGERRWHLAVPGVLGAAGLCLSVAFAGNTALAMLALTIGTMGIMTTISQFWTLPPAILGGAAAAAGIALANSVGSISGVISPYLIGWVQSSTGTTGNGVLVLAASLVIGGMLVFTVPASLVNSAARKD
ncbi:MFS transporter [Cupriavidus oxalaticus]|jgi:D-galactonate transporter|uniref:MFS transporter n=1 Tax=Cupriavidus oxalaticus TaxID=96344 RepID=A0A375GMI0_9BURK|nr:MFS transporter [Cupriavidus oxalaticus]QRQ85171.1 MFS transporter [Cupriavidus oxalaticus]QRQ90741.1 MFS transporter [Cupriavidus oxalaticus]WQD85268.1 MFS transporter [Cupriavidus oxalaticus]SPC23387.1 putative metabolite transport protein NicT [Cupriavidus oxalaticus]